VNPPDSARGFNGSNAPSSCAGRRARTCARVRVKEEDGKNRSAFVGKGTPPRDASSLILSLPLFFLFRSISRFLDLRSSRFAIDRGEDRRRVIACSREIATARNGTKCISVNSGLIRGRNVCSTVGTKLNGASEDTDCSC